MPQPEPEKWRNWQNRSVNMLFFKHKIIIFFILLSSLIPFFAVHFQEKINNRQRSLCNIYDCRNFRWVFIDSGTFKLSVLKFGSENISLGFKLWFCWLNEFKLFLMFSLLICLITLLNHKVPVLTWNQLWLDINSALQSWFSNNVINLSHILVRIISFSQGCSNFFCNEKVLWV